MGKEGQSKKILEHQLRIEKDFRIYRFFPFCHPQCFSLPFEGRKPIIEINEESIMNHVALITGGSSGLGYCIAREFAKNGFNILIVSHNPSANDDAVAKIKQEFHVQVLSYTIDLREDTSAEAVYGYCRENGIEVEALVNNAGTGNYGPFAESFVDDNEAIVQLDVVTLIDLTYLFLHHMLEAGKGYIMNVTSTAAFQPGPNVAVYYASKAFVESFTEAIAEENCHSGIAISAFCPGPVASPFLKNTGMDRSVLVEKFKPGDPEKLAHYAFEKLMKGVVVIIPGGKNKRRVFATRLFSRKRIRHMMAKITAPKKD
jgi:short-subunit dehydrogenase